MKVVVSSTSNGDLAERAVIELGGEPVFACLHAPRAHSIRGPVSFHTDEAHYIAWLKNFFSEVTGRALFFSTAASDRMQLSDLSMKDIVVDAGGDYVGQSSFAIAQTIDKEVSLAVAAQVNLLLAPRALVSDDVKSDRQYVIKKLCGDGGEGQSVFSGPKLIDVLKRSGMPVGFLAEEFIDGIEVSVSVFARDHTFYMGPLSVKGRTSIKNLHAVEKIRIIYPGRMQTLESILAPYCKKLSDLIQCCGWLDIEFIISGGKIFFLEINARFNGLSRLGYLATGINPYSVMLAGRIPEGVRASNCAMEIPVSIADTAEQHVENVFYTSFASPGNGRTKGKYSFSAPDVNELYKVASLFATSESVDRAFRDVEILESWFSS